MIAVQSACFHGPLPPPPVLREYEEVLPGLGERIVQMAENEGNHRRSVEKILVHLSTWGLASAWSICLVAVVGGLLLLGKGKPLSGLPPLLLALAALIANMVLHRASSPPADVTEGDASAGSRA